MNWVPMWNLMAIHLTCMYHRRNFEHLKVAVNEYCLEGEDPKYGLKSALYYLIKRSCKIMKGTFLVNEDDDAAHALDKFNEVLDLHHDLVFGDATYAVGKAGTEKLRKPETLPLEDDVQSVREYALNRMKELVEKETYGVYEGDRHVELRDLVISRLTLFNAQRGGEPCILTRNDWKEAKEGTWINQQALKHLNQAEKKTLEKYKITYQTRKGIRKLVPVLIPKDCDKALHLVDHDEVRENAGIVEGNKYLFPSTQGSTSHASGWHAVHRVVQKVADLKRPTLITATRNRHRISTLYAAMDVEPSERKYFYSHMGHSKEMNTNTYMYQAPLALMEVVKVGTSLSKIDGKFLLYFLLLLFALKVLCNSCWMS